MHAKLKLHPLKQLLVTKLLIQLALKQTRVGYNLVKCARSKLTSLKSHC
jgi:hypothetical protein